MKDCIQSREGFERTELIRKTLTPTTYIFLIAHLSPKSADKDATMSMLNYAEKIKQEKGENDDVISEVISNHYSYGLE